MGESLWRRVFQAHPARGPARRRVLAISVSAEDHLFYAKLRYHGEWDVVATHSVPEALGLLDGHQFSMVLCDRDLPGWDWRETIARLVAAAPRTCVLLTSRVSDGFLWREVVLLGGYDVVPKPLADETVLHALHRAWYYWQREPCLARPEDGPS